VAAEAVVTGEASSLHDIFVYLRSVAMWAAVVRALKTGIPRWSTAVMHLW